MKKNRKAILKKRLKGRKRGKEPNRIMEDRQNRNKNTDRTKLRKNKFWREN